MSARNSENVPTPNLRHCAPAVPSKPGPPMIFASLERVQLGPIGEAVVWLGITELYVTLVLGIGKLFRLSIGNMRMRIPYQDLPNLSHLWILCNDITVARQEKGFLLEEQLFYHQPVQVTPGSFRVDEKEPVKQLLCAVCGHARPSRAAPLICSLSAGGFHEYDADSHLRRLPRRQRRVVISGHLTL